ncbi:MAG: MBL fold metallo-hydrolase [Bacilli bacterium]|nr:MBL fold metallo-hydrolase [Bacilli bacterium]
MKICVLSSGSKGNCTYVETKKHKFLIDIGTSCLYVENALKNINVLPQDIDTIFITHSHVDHVSGLKVFAKKYHPQVCLTPLILEEINLSLDNICFIEDKLDFDDTVVYAIKTSHDTKDSNAYVIEEGNASMVNITDTGYINEKYFNLLADKNVYVFESNHDVEMLMNNSHYPHHIKNRIMGDKGHLSNKDSAYYLSRLIGKKTQKVILAHLSEQNNTSALALQTLQDTLRKREIFFENIVCAEQNKQTELIEI